MTPRPIDQEADPPVPRDPGEGATVPLTPDLRQFVESCRWTFAKTYAETWPHEYLVRGRVDEALFVRLVEHVRAHGYDGRFYTTPIRYFDEGGMVYWTMGAPVEETTIINRCRKEETYEYRLAQGTLPRALPVTHGRS